MLLLLLLLLLLQKLSPSPLKLC